MILRHNVGATIYLFGETLSINAKERSLELVNKKGITYKLYLVYKVDTWIVTDKEHPMTGWVSSKTIRPTEYIFYNQSPEDIREDFLRYAKANKPNPTTHGMIR